MPRVVVAYDLDLGALGNHQVDVIGRIDRGFDGLIVIDIVEVAWRSEPGETVDLFPHIRQRDLDAMKNKIRNDYLTQILRGRESSGEIVA